MADGDILLYDHGPSPFARIVRLALSEKGLNYKKRDVDYSMAMEHLQPFYAHVNPKMQVPCLSVTHKGERRVITDSKEILLFLENDFDGGSTPLVEGGKQKDVWTFVDDFYDIEPMALYYNNFRVKQPPVFEMMKDIHAKQVKQVTLNALKYPELKDVYEKKKEQMMTYKARFIDSTERVEPNQKKMDDLIAKAEKLLSDSDSEWLFGTYSVADVVLTCLLAMMLTMGLMSLEDKLSLGAFYARAKQRPSYKVAAISDSMPLKMKVLMSLGSVFYKIKGAIMPSVNKGIEEADKMVAEVKQKANEELDKAIGVSKK